MQNQYVVECKLYQVHFVLITVFFNYLIDNTVKSCILYRTSKKTRVDWNTSFHLLTELKCTFFPHGAFIRLCFKLSFQL